MNDRRDWYSISVDTIRGWIVLCVLAATGVVAFFAWEHWEGYALEKSALATLQEAEALSQEVKTQPDLSAFEDEVSDARASLAEARDAIAAKEFDAALKAGRRCVALLSSILSAVRDQGTGGEAHVISLGGRVEIKRGELGEWEEARPRSSLRDGYYLRTSRSGSAEIMFADGTLYQVRPNTLFVLTPAATGTGDVVQSIRMEYGNVNLSTSKRASRIETPGADAEVRKESRADVTYDREAGAGRFAAHRGTVKVASAGGTTRELGALEEIVQRGDQLSEPRRLPAAPELLEPRDSYERSVSSGQLRLAWRPQSDADHYVLQVSRNQLFVDNVIDEPRRAKSSATLEVRGEGTFVWRVAAVAGGDRQGPWSSIRQFRVLPARSGAGRSDRDTEPPRLALKEVQPYGNIFILNGSTEPGALVTVRGEAVNVSADGSFTKTLQVMESGWTFVDVRARDAYGNEATKQLRVYVEDL